MSAEPDWVWWLNLTTPEVIAIWHRLAVVGGSDYEAATEELLFRGL